MRDYILVAGSVLWGYLGGILWCTIRDRIWPPKRLSDPVEVPPFEVVDED